MTPEQTERAARFAALHRGPGTFVLPNAWDAASALLFQAAGFPAVEAADRLDRTLDRLRAYVAAGADGVFVPGLREPADLTAVVQGVEAPLNVVALPGLPPVPELGKLGVARLSVGSGAMRAVYGKLRKLAAELQGPGTYESLMEDALTGAEMQALMP